MSIKTFNEINILNKCNIIIIVLITIQNGMTQLEPSID